MDHMILPPPDEPMKVARRLASKFFTNDGVLVQRNWRGGWWQWREQVEAARAGQAGGRRASVDERPRSRRHADGVAGAAVTLRNLAVAAFVLAALLYGQLDNGDRAQEPKGAPKAPSR